MPAGSLESKERVFRARVERSFKKPEDFKRLVLAEGTDASGQSYLIRLEDVARVELGVVEDRTMFRGNTVPMVGIGVIRQSTANTIDVANGVMGLTEKLNKNLPDGMSIKQSFNAAVFIEAAIGEVYQTLFFAILCVVFVIYLFLGSVRATLLPAVTVPVSLIATFIIIWNLGFSINLLTLLALVLAIGLVVDDAIVMLENIVRRIKDLGESPLVAAYRGARQVGFAVIATTLVLIAVFVPITFIEGDIGRLFTEFALTIAAAVSISSFIALTLTPMLASKIISHKSFSKHGLITGVDRIISKTRDGYGRLLEMMLKKPVGILAGFVAVVGLSAILYPNIAQEFTPKEDRGAFFVIVNGPEGSSYSYMKEYMDEIEKRMMPYVETGEINRLLVRAPRAFGNIENFSGGIVIVILNDWANRRPAEEIMGEIRRNLAELPGVRAFPVMRQGLGGGSGKPVQFVLGGSTYEELASWRDIIIDKVNENNPGFTGLDSDYKETRPQIDFKVDYDRAADLGVSVQAIGRTLETMMGGRRVTTFLDRGQEYDVIVEGERSKQQSLSDIQNIYIESDRDGGLIPLSNLVTMEEYGAADNLARFNRIRSITLEANLEDGYRLGDALNHLEKLVDEHLPAEAIIDYKGQSRDFVNSGSSLLFVFALGLLVTFLVLAAQFESWIHPFVIMLTVPLAISGGLLGLFLTGNSLNIYSQIGLIMLVGLSAKNGILIVEFANQLRDQGKEFKEALVEASIKRFRPIVMTALTTIAGSVPLILSSGAGSETRAVIGIVVLAGVLVATILTLFVVPVIYNILARNSGTPQGVTKQIEESLAAAPQDAAHGT